MNLNESFEDHPYARNARKRKNEETVLEISPRSKSADHSHGKKGKDKSHSFETVDVDFENPEQNFPTPSVNSNTVCIKGNEYTVTNVPGDGNCLFHCLSLALHDNRSYVHIFRQVISGAVAHEWDFYKNMTEQSHAKQFLSANDYLFHMLVQNAWGTACEINAASKVLKANIVTFLQGGRSNEVTYHEVRYTPESRTEKYIYLLLADGHFQLLDTNETNETRSVPAICSAQEALQETVDRILLEDKQHACTFKVTGDSSSNKKMQNPSTCSKVTGTTSKHNVEFPSQSEQSNLDNLPDVNSNVQGKITIHINQDTDEVYLPQEADIYLKCRKLGVVFQPSKRNETKQEKNTRMKRNRSNLRYKENKLNIKVSSLPDPHP